MHFGRLVLCLCLFGALSTAPAVAKGPAAESPTADLEERLLTSEDPEIRSLAALQLGQRNPDGLARVLDVLVKEEREGDAELLASVALKSKVRHSRLLLVWAVAELGDAVAIFADRIDNDFPVQSVYALEALAFTGDVSVVEKMLGLVRGSDERIALQAIRVLSRHATKKHANDILDAALNVNNPHLRTHLTWALQDVLGSTDKAKKMFARFVRQEGTLGHRADTSMLLLADAEAPPEKFKAKFATVRSFFTPRGGVKEPGVTGPREAVERVKAILAGMKERLPAYHHMFCTSVAKVQMTDAPWTVDCQQRAVNLRPRRLARWDRDELFDYYFIRYATILFLSRLGDPCEGHRGWEEGCLEGWQYARDSGKIGVNEDPCKFMEGVVKDPPW